jgi:hypothetical protein
MRNGIFSRQSILELSLLAVFAAGLFSAKLIVDFRGRILLGPGIQLAGSGLTVFLPTQHGWRGLKQWQYERDNTFVLPASLMGRSSPIVDVSWKYILASTVGGSRQVLEELASETDGKLLDIQSTTGSCPMEYGPLSAPQYGDQHYIGAAVLDFGRVLVLQVKGQAGDPFLVQEVFLALARSLEYKKPDELTKGVELLTKARNFGTELFPSEPSTNFLIRDASGNVRGYETVQVQIDPKQQLQITRTTSLTTGVAGQREHRFESFRPFEMFDWRCQNNNHSRPPGSYHLELKEDKMLTIEDTAGQTRAFQPGPVMTGEILLDWLVRYFLETEQQKTVVDILYFDGLIIPAQIFSIPPAEAMGKTEEMAFAVRIESLGGSATEFYFGADKKLLGKITMDPSRKILLWEPVEANEIKKYFDMPPSRKGPTAKSRTEKENEFLCLMKEKQV